MNKITKIIGGIVLTAFAMFINITNVNAASASISVSTSTSKIVVGKTFTATVKISSGSALGSWEWVINYDTSKFKLTGGDTYVADFGDGSKKSASYKYTFKAIGAGSGSIGVKSYGGYAWEGNEKFSISAGSKSVKVITQADLEASYSKNNDLKNLEVEGLKLSPEFSKDTLEYSCEAGANIEKVKIKTTKSDSKASVSGDGEVEVSEGDNSFKVTVTAENGSTKTYSVTVKVVDPNPIEVTVNNQKFTVVKREQNLTAPEGYEKKEVTIKEQKIPGFYNDASKYTLVGLKDDKGNVSNYIYDEKNSTYTKYTEIKLDQLKIFTLPIDEKFNSNYKKTTIKIADNDVQVLSMEKSEYAIIYAKDLTSGKENYYLYDTKLNTIIRYNDEEVSIYRNINTKYEKIILLLLVETAIIFVVLIILLIKKLCKNKKKKRFLESKLEEISKDIREKEKDEHEEKEELEQQNTEKIKNINTKKSKTEKIVLEEIMKNNKDKKKKSPKKDNEEETKELED